MDKLIVISVIVWIVWAWGADEREQAARDDAYADAYADAIADMEHRIPHNKTRYFNRATGQYEWR